VYICLIVFYCANVVKSKQSKAYEDMRRRSSEATISLFLSQGQPSLAGVPRPSPRISLLSRVDPTRPLRSGHRMIVTGWPPDPRARFARTPSYALHAFQPNQLESSARDFTSEKKALGCHDSLSLAPAGRRHTKAYEGPSEASHGGPGGLAPLEEAIRRLERNEPPGGSAGWSAGLGPQEKAIVN
jgi:hypothetical protein